MCKHVVGMYIHLPMHLNTQDEDEVKINVRSTSVKVHDTAHIIYMNVLNIVHICHWYRIYLLLKRLRRLWHVLLIYTNAKKGCLML